MAQVSNGADAWHTRRPRPQRVAVVHRPPRL